MRTMIFMPSGKTSERLAGDKKLWVEMRGYKSEGEGAQGSQKTQKNLGQFLVLGGTTEGREAAAALHGLGYSVTVSVTRDAGAATVPEGASILVGARDADGWDALLGPAAPSLIGVVDATHPFADKASREITKSCRKAGVPLCRYLRPRVIPDGAQTAPSIEEAASRAVELTNEGDTIFLAIGTNDLGLVVPMLREAKRGVLARMLPTVESLRSAERAGVEPKEIVASWGAGSSLYIEALCRDRDVRAIVSRESGAPGGTGGKSEAASCLGIPLVLVDRPAEEPDGATASNPDELISWCSEISAHDAAD